MPERRRHDRVSKRMQVEYGEDDLGTRGLVTDISVGGLFIRCSRPKDIGTRLHLHVLDPAGDFYAEGVVVRQRRVDRRYQVLESQGMGVRFLQPAELVKAVIPESRRRKETNTLSYASPAGVEKVLSEQLASGHLLVPVDEESPRAGTVVEFTIRLEFGSKETIEGQGRVLQVFPQGDQTQVLIEVQDAGQLRSSLEQGLS